MSYLKNTASQKFNVLAINAATSLPVTGDAANITAQISIDAGAFAAVSDTNPTELDATNAPGVYVFDLTQAETNGDVLTIVPSSTTANVQMDMINIYTVDPATYKADVSGLATAIALGITDGKCTSILTNTGTTIPAQITALNDFDPASDTVANVTLVATTTTNTDMRGTDNAAAASSLSITNSSVNTIKAVTNNLPDSGALSSLATASDLATVDTVVDAILVDTGTTIPAQITALNNLDAAGIRSAVGLASANLDTQIADLPTVAEFEARTLVAAAYFDPVSDAVANVTLCDTTTTNTDMRGTDSAAAASSLAVTNSSVNTIKTVTNNLPDSGALTSLATASDLATVDTVVDAILVDTGTTIPSQITALNNLDAAGVRSAVGLASADLDTQLGDIPTVSEFEARTLVASAYFDPVSDAVANVTLVGTCTTNTDMRGTDNAAAASSLAITNSSVNTIKTVTNNLPDSGALTSLATASDLATVDTVVDAILIDTGTTIPAQITGLNDIDAAGVRSAVGLASANLDTQIADLPTVAEFEARTITASAYFDPASDVVANVTLVDTTTTNTDMRGTDSAALASSLSITNANVNTIKTVTDVIPDSGTMTSIATRANQITIDGKADDIKAKTDQMAFTVANQIDANALTGGGGDDAATIYTYFTSGTNENAFKADITALATASSVSALNDFDPVNDVVANVTLVGTTTTNTDMRGTDSANTIAPANSDVAAIKAKTDQFVFTVPNQVDANSLTGGTSASAIYTYFTSGTNENAFKADVSSLATSSALATVDLNVDAILVDTSSTIPLSIAVTDGKVSSILTDTNTTIPSQISGLNDFNPATDTVSNVSNVALVATTTTNTDMRGTDGANTTTPPSVSSIVSGISAETYDGVAFEDVMKVLLSMAQGKIVESSSGVFEFYAQDDATVLYTLTKSGSQRNRS